MKVTLQLLDIRSAVQRCVAIALPVQNLQDLAVIDSDRIDAAGEKIAGVRFAPDREFRYKDGQETLHIGQPKRLQRGRCEFGWSRERSLCGLDGKKLVEKALGANGNIDPAARVRLSEALP